MRARDIQRAARIGAAFLFGLALLLVVRALDGSTVPTQRYLVSVGGSLVLALLALLLPWPRLGRWTTLVLPLSALTLFGFSLAAAVSHPSAYLLYPFAGFVWFGLAYPPGVALRLAVPGLALITGPALLTGTRPREVLAYPVVILLAALVAEMLSRLVSELRVALSDSRSSDRARAAVIATLAHDLRSPAAMVAGSMRLLRERDDELEPEVRAELLGAAERQAERLLDLADSLVDSDRLRGQPLTLRRTPTRVVDLVDRAGWLTDVEVAVTGDLDAVVDVDARRLQHVLTNLLENAVRHGAPPVEVDIVAAGDEVRVHVRDHGPGVPDRLGDEVFGRYVHGGADGSTGLGLWLARSLVEAHGGRLDLAAADPGAAETTGARFVIALPAVG